MSAQGASAKMSRRDLVALHTLLARFQRYLDSKHPLNPASDRAAQVKRDVDMAIMESGK
jgi:hypothetical protein